MGSAAVAALPPKMDEKLKMERNMATWISVITGDAPMGCM
jgi:hypothetical protein